MPEGRITKKAVDALSCPSGKDRVFLWDDDLAGFGVAAFPTGRKFYVYQYRQHGRTRRATLGEHGRLTPDEARSEAKKLLGDVEKGADPIAQRKAARAVRTFKEVAEDFVALHVAAKRKGRTKAEYEALLRSHILPAIGSRRVMDVRRADVARLHARMADTPFQANRALAVVSAVWTWASRRDEVDAAKNPARGIERNPEEGRERFLKADEVARLGDALTLAENEGLPYAVDETKPGAKHAPKLENRRVGIDPHAAAALRLLIFTGARLREILDARWQHVDFERGALFLPDSKTGKKPIFLSAPAQAVLTNLAERRAKDQRLKANPYIIAGANDAAPRADLKKPWAAICRAAQLEGVRLHDLRHTFASYGAGAGLGLPIVGKLLGHTQAATTQRYAHLDADPLRRAADAIGAQIAAAMNRTNGAEIVTLKTRGA